MDASRITARLLLALGAASLAAGDLTACGTAIDLGAASTSGGSGGSSNSTTGSTGGTGGVGGSSATDAGDADATVTDALDELVFVLPDGASDAADAAEDHTPPCPRRPFLVGREPRTATVRRRADWRRAIDHRIEPLDARTAAALSAAWLADARSEHASIAAFARFTMLMIGVGAPPALVAGSQRASLDEIRHARDCFALASRYAGADLGPDRLDLEGAMGPASIVDLAVLTVHEGCVGESIGVLLASEMLRRAVDPFARQALERIVRDEMRHTELAWRFVQWALSAGGAAVRPAVARAFAQAARASLATTDQPDLAVDLDAWHAHGRVTVSEAREVVTRALRQVIAPCSRALFAGSQPSSAPRIPTDPIAPGANDPSTAVSDRLSSAPGRTAHVPLGT